MNLGESVVERTTGQRADDAGAVEQCAAVDDRRGRFNEQNVGWRAARH